MNDVRTYARAKRLVERRFFFVVHLSIYIPVIALLVGIDYGWGTPPHWSWMVAWGWGIGIVTHAVSVFVLADTKSRTPLQETLRERRIVFFLHLFVYLNVVLLCVTVNATTMPHQTADVRDSWLLSYWAIWPALFWGIGVFYHWLFGVIIRGWRVKKLKQAWTLKVMEEIDGVSRDDKIDEDLALSFKPKGTKTGS